jgi:hypothetical protein
MASIDDPDQPHAPLSTRRTQNLSTSSTASALSGPASTVGSQEEISRRRPMHERRPYSDYGQIHKKIQVHTITEGFVDHAASSQRSEPTTSKSTRREMSQDPVAETSTSSKSSVKSRLYQHTVSQPPEGTRPENLTRRPQRPGHGRHWTRTKSGSVWYERLRGSSDKSKDSLSVSSSEALQRSLVPLQPPKSAIQPTETDERHLVRVEKSFTRLKPPAVPTGEVPTVPSSRRSSINPRRLFSVPLQLVRRWSWPKRKPEANLRELSESHHDTHHRHLADHTSLLKKDGTSEALRRVASILCDTDMVARATSPVSVITTSRIRSISGRSDSSKASSPVKKDSRKRRGQHSKYGRVDSDVSLQAEQSDTSYTSSQLAIRLGLQPNNTPDEQATYKIKRSSSAETEEFLKVDISIRGGTSYLPSEARRIHTPPLPEDGPGGKKRGFFFDYNAAKAAEQKKYSLYPDAIPTRSTSRATTVGRKSILTAGRIVTKSRTNDWYETQLAQLDDLDEAGPSPDREPYKRPDMESNRERSGTETSLAAMKKRRDEALLDYSIPEHLPSSPLCPRNPKYWRVVKGKGSQFRGCWMHGIGAWQPHEVPGMRPAQ